MIRIGARAALWGQAGLCAFTIACAGANEAGSTAASGGPRPASLSSASGPCEQRVEAAQVQLATHTEPLPPRVGSFVLELRIAQRTLARAVQARLPRVLATAQQQAIGVAGKVSYEVIREQVEVGVRDGALTVKTRARVELEVCKPFAGSCIRYGRCEPEFDITARVPVNITRLPLSSAVSVNTVRGCVLRPVGLDITAKIESVVEREVRAVQRRIDKELKHFAFDESLWARQRVGSWTLASGACLAPRLRSLAQAPLVEDAGDVVLPLVLTGSLEVLGDCSRSTPNALPALEYRREPPVGSVLWLRQSLDYDALAGALLASLSTAGELSPSRSAVKSVKMLGPVQYQTSGPLLGINLDLEGGICGTQTLFSRVVAQQISRAPTESARAAAPWQLRLIPQSSTATVAHPAAQQVSLHVSQHAAVPLETHVQRELAEAVALLSSHFAPVKGTLLWPTAEWQLARDAIGVEGNGLTLDWSREGALVLRLESLP